MRQYLTGFRSSNEGQYIGKEGVKGRIIRDKDTERAGVKIIQDL